MAGRRYRFRTTWSLPAPVPPVYEVLADLAGYPRWWPQVRSVVRAPGTGEEDRALVRCRSLLPYVLVLEAWPRQRDPVAGVLELGLDGDLSGWARFTLRAGPGGTSAGYEQEVRVTRPGLETAGRLLRPLLVANHAWMMRGGRRGLAAHLAGRR